MKLLSRFLKTWGRIVSVCFYWLEERFHKISNYFVTCGLCRLGVEFSQLCFSASCGSLYCLLRDWCMTEEVLDLKKLFSCKTQGVCILTFKLRLADEDVSNSLFVCFVLFFINAFFHKSDLCRENERDFFCSSATRVIQTYFFFVLFWHASRLHCTAGDTIMDTCNTNDTWITISKYCIRRLCEKLKITNPNLHTCL